MEFETATRRLAADIAEAETDIDGLGYFVAIDAAEYRARDLLDADLSPGQEAQQLSDWTKFIERSRYERTLRNLPLDIGLLAIGIRTAMKEAYATAQGSSGKSRSRRGGIPGLPPSQTPNFQG